MLRLLRFILGLGLLVAGAVWLADRPGAAALEWLGWRVETNVPLLLVLLLLVGFLLFWLARFFGFLFGMPSVFGRVLAERRRRKGYEALTKGLVAVAAGDPKEALRQARHADGFLDAPPLSLLLAAQAAQLAGDEAGAARHFLSMRERPETEFLALRGLMTQALKKGDHDGALELARRAYQLKPEAEWVFTALFSLLVEKKAWNEAVELVKKAAKHRLIDQAVSKRRQALLTLEAACEAADPQHGAKLAHKALELAPDLSFAAVAAAAFHAKAGKTSKAVKVIAEAWRANPHPSLLDALENAMGQASPLEFVQAVERMTEAAAGSQESRMALAKAALKAKLWGKARAALEPLAGESRPQARVIALMAAVDEAEGRLSDSISWLRKLPDAAQDPVWICRDCGHLAEEWGPTCPSCRGFDRLDWKAPEQTSITLSGV